MTQIERGNLSNLLNMSWSHGGKLWDWLSVERACGMTSDRGKLGCRPLACLPCACLPAINNVVTVSCWSSKNPKGS